MRPRLSPGLGLSTPPQGHLSRRRVPHPSLPLCAYPPRWDHHLASPVHHGAARGALETPDGDPTEADTRIMGVTGEAPAAATGGLVEELKAQGQEKGEDAFDKRLPVTKE